MQSLNKREYIGQFIRFGIVGVIATAVHYGIYYLLLPVMSHNLAYTIGYFLSFIMNYLLTTAFTFRTRRSVGNGIGFAVCHGINYLMQMGLLNLFICMGLNKVLAPVPVYCICIPTNFILVRLVMKRFSGKASDDMPEAA